MGKTRGQEGSVSSVKEQLREANIAAHINNKTLDQAEVTELLKLAYTNEEKRVFEQANDAAGKGEIDYTLSMLRDLKKDAVEVGCTFNKKEADKIMQFAYRSYRDYELRRALNALSWDEYARGEGSFSHKDEFLAGICFKYARKCTRKLGLLKTLEFEIKYLPVSWELFRYSVGKTLGADHSDVEIESPLLNAVAGLFRRGPKQHDVTVRIRK